MSAPALDGPKIAQAKRRLLARLPGLGYPLDKDGDPHVRIENLRIDPIRLGAARIGFVLPPHRGAAILASSTFVPAHVDPDSEDWRELGLCVRRLKVDGRDVDLAAGAPAGWREPDNAGGAFSNRWTSGAARLPPGVRIVVVDLAGHGRYWRAADAGARTDSIERQVG